MALSVDLIGLGIDPGQAQRLGTTQITTVAGVGTAQAGAAAIRVDNVLATTAGGATAFVLPSTASIDNEIWVTNSTATAALVFPPVGGAINAAATDASVSIAQNLARVFIRKSQTRWISFLTA